MTSRLGRWFLIALLGSLMLAALPSWADEARLAISGYDPVAYFTDGRPVPGQSDFQYRWHEAQWRFASPAHRDAFAGNPDHYAPQYDGYCALGVALSPDKAHKDTVDPEAWAIVDGKLYLAHDKHWIEVWRENPSENIQRANDNWPSVKEQPVTYDSYPNNPRTDKN
jgi:hypothetical protein